MQIYFTTTIKASIDNKENIKSLLDHLQTRGHKVYLRTKMYELEDSKKGYGIDLVPSDKSVDKLTNIFLQNQKRIQQADIVICEMSTPSSGTGYDIAQAILANKPVLILCNKNYKLSDTFAGNSSKRLKSKYYNNEDIISLVDEFLHETKKMLDSKFILIIPPEIEQYLSWASHKKGVRKAKIVRSAIDKFMEHDIDYKKFIVDINK